MMTRHTLLTLAALAASALPLGPRAHAQPIENPDDVCAPNEGATPLRLLRQYSLDLRGQIQTHEEYLRVRDAEVPMAEVERIREEMLASDEFRRTVRDYHQRLLWSNFSADVVMDVVDPSRELVQDPASGIWYQPAQSERYRGSAGQVCRNTPQRAFDDAGYPVAESTGGGFGGGGAPMDGYVMVQPYWAPDTEIRVCAFDAQALPTQRDGSACGYGRLGAECGCGPNLQHCVPRAGQPGAVAERLRAALAEEPLRLVEEVVTSGRSYLDIFRADQTQVNGALAHYYRFLNEPEEDELEGRVSYYLGVAAGEMEGMSFADESWRSVPREGAAGAGVLTSPAYLVRFPSNRGRASRFYEAFFCDPFVSNMPIDRESAPHPNLRQVAGCSDCHERLEPAAAHWGRFRTGEEVGMFQFDMNATNAECAACVPEGSDEPGEVCSAFCNSYYVTKANSHPLQVEAYLGHPLPMAWLEEGEEVDVALGPANLVDEPGEQSRIAACAVRTLAQRLLHRDLTLDDLEWLGDQTRSFEGDWDWVAMVERMTSDPRYLETHE